jgi:hypothetical protein
MDWVKDFALVLSSVGASLFVPKLVTGFVHAITGRGARQRSEIERVRALADREAYRRRIAQEHASHLRRLLYEAPCVAVESIPPNPTYSREDTPDEEAP